MKSVQTLPILPPRGASPPPVPRTRTRRVPLDYSGARSNANNMGENLDEFRAEMPGARLPVFSAPDTSRGGGGDPWLGREEEMEIPKPKSKKKKKRPSTAASPFSTGKMTLSGPVASRGGYRGRPHTAPRRPVPPPPLRQSYSRGPNHSIMRDSRAPVRPPWDPAPARPAPFDAGLSGTGITNLGNYIKNERQTPKTESPPKKAEKRPKKRAAGGKNTAENDANEGDIILGPGFPLWEALSRRDLDALEACVDRLLALGAPGLLETCAALLEQALEGKGGECNLPGGPNDIMGGPGKGKSGENGPGSTLYPTGPAFTAWLRHTVNRDREAREKREAVARREERKRRALLRREAWKERERERGWADPDVGPPSRR
eukprot:TRINITY_DN659_c3_g1_i1.p1 TRINITY_DN659_c3_g1~~TRINITY_DN659_c3_g1_i1.p1  ORF type:complete len:374 (+),score=30.58 TRINITY_DN659_c3_g1_i1:395-1516(+)